MKKIIVVFMLSVLLILTLTACDSGESVIDYEVDTNLSSPFQLVRETVINVGNLNDDRIENVQYYVEMNTQLMYVYVIDWDANATRGGFCPLYNTDGTIMTYEQFQKNYVN